MPVAYNTIAYDVAADGILTITLNRPDRLNAYTPEMCAELVDAFGRASREDAVKAVVVTGAGRAYCAGMDLASEGNVFGLDETQNPSLDELREGFDDPVLVNGVRDTGGRLTLAIFNCAKPVIAAVNGVAVGIGATMICAMDVRLCSDKAKFGFVFGKLGIVPEACSTWFLPRLVGLSRALEWCYTGDLIAPEEAVAAGLVKAVYPADELLEQAYALARRFSQGKSAVGIALTRQMIHRNSTLDSPLEAHLLESLAVFHTSQKDGREGVKAFQEKRPPNFTDTVSRDMPAFYPWWKPGQ
jgi:enoyl-CoA hydratase/carnithine racemase